MSGMVPSAADTVFQVRIHNYLHLTPSLLVLYDHLLTLDTEVQFFWTKWKAVSAILFFLNRYFASASSISNFLFGFEDTLTPVGCKRYNFFRQIQLIITEVLVGILLILRTFALYERNRKVLYGMLIIALGLVGAAASSLFSQNATPTPQSQLGCHLAVDFETSKREAIAWEALMAFDTMIFSLTVYKTWSSRRQRSQIGYVRIPLISMMLRDGAIYYAIMVLSNLMNVLTFYFLGPYLKGVLSTFASSISVTMMSRLMLNLQQSVSTTNPGSRARETMASMQFAGGQRSGQTQSVDPNQD